MFDAGGATGSDGNNTPGWGGIGLGVVFGAGVYCVAVFRSNIGCGAATANAGVAGTEGKAGIVGVVISSAAVLGVNTAGGIG